MKNWRKAITALLFALGTAGAQGDSVTISYLEGKAPVAPDAMTAYGVDLFGDRINLYNGSLSFQHTDLSLPGNNALPVALVRSHSPGRSHQVRGQLGTWDIETPRIGGSFSQLRGWVTSSGGVDRCSGFSLPPIVSVGGGGPSSSTLPSVLPRPPAGAASTPEPNATSVVGFNASNYWQGTHITVPGQGSQEVLRRSSGYTGSPSDASYPLVTHQNWQIRCLPSIQNGSGEGFLAVAPDGTRYRFDWMASRQQTNVKKAGAEIARQDVYLMATQVSDRFGNWVRYSYDSANPMLLTRIESSDGRLITVGNASGRAASASDGTRSVTYGYNGIGSLTSVRQNDGSTWTFNLDGMVPATLQTAGEGATCDTVGDFPSEALTGTITHPSGAVGSFTTNFVLLGRTFVERYCIPHPNGTSATIGAVYPRYVNTQALTAKQISGPGMATLSWGYAYTAPGGWTTCTTCSQERTITVTEPSGSRTRHVFGNRWRVSEGQLLRLDEGWNGSTALRTTNYRYRQPAGQAYPEQFGVSLLPNEDWLASRHRPEDLRTVSQQGQTFTHEVLNTAAGFDYYVRPTQVRKYSSLGFSRTERTSYNDHLGHWVMGQIASVTEVAVGQVMEANSYYPATALKATTSRFGKQIEAFEYNPDGTLAVVRDQANRPIQLLQHKRGKPQTVLYPDGTSESQVINNLGNADSRTNAAGSTTTYQYDAMGRVSAVIYPTGDPVGYSPTIQTFEQVGSSEFGIAAGHWRQTISTGNARKVRFFDALWRERLEWSYDAGNSAATSKFEETRYDKLGKTSFVSYPQRTFGTVDGAIGGQTTTNDALGRPTLQVASSELGNLSTVITYPANLFQRVVKNPRNFSTTYAFQAFETPSEDSIAQISAPEGVTLTIQRDVFGKALHMTRAGGGLSATRSYVYDNFHRLCKTVEPETGATVQDYDAAGNVAWRAPGQALAGTSSCDLGSVSPSAVISFGYDARNRLKTTSYADGSPAVTRNYESDGLLRSIESGGVTWVYDYNRRRLMYRETISGAGQSYAFNHGIDSQGNRVSLTYPSGLNVAYAPNALGEPTQVGGYASGVAFHPNGQLGNYTTGSGIAFSATQNARGLPLRWSHAGVVNDEYSYDGNGNVSRIADLQEAGATTRVLGYDGLDRLKTASGIWGSGSFTYDGLDNLRSASLGSKSISTTLDAQLRIGSITVNGSAQTIGYDAYGSVRSKGSQTYGFDLGNRMTAATGKASYLYDGHGRRVWMAFADGKTRLQVYSNDGRLLLTQDSAQGRTEHIYLGSQLIAEVGPTGVEYPHTDALGSPVARTNAARQILSRTRYEPYGGIHSGTAPTVVGYTGHAQDADTGLVYMQQRYYEPLIGRFLSVDPVLANTADGASFNRYEYAESNPYRYTDPDGREIVGYFSGDSTSRLDGQVQGGGKKNGAGPRVHPDPKSLVGKPALPNAEGSNECVELVKQTVGNRQPTTTWRKGEKVDEKTLPGTAIAAGWDLDGRFPGDRETGQHAGLLASNKRADGSFSIVDQSRHILEYQGAIGMRNVRPKPFDLGSSSNNAREYYVIIFGK
ncbi:BPSL0067 family protein [Inhella sp.]|uniref:BPSL0067 family protein n=1 Tax=Inhella sp. TaxID=1921806 RepID=UPI0035B34587